VVPRLDIWLVEKGYFTSRQSAKRAIREGNVTVNGRTTKPSHEVGGLEDILVMSTARDLPKGYRKLEKLDSVSGGRISTPGSHALDIGSSAGGFLSYLIEKGVSVTGIEVSEEFSPQLESIVSASDRASLIVADAFDLEPTVVCDYGRLDSLLIDVTTEPSGTLALVNRFSPLLKSSGILLAAFKSRRKDEIEAIVRVALENLGYGNTQIIELEGTRKEFHVLTVRQ
jgi:23S rRNA (cytidine1920-2'-O)/16S rRNA (cytidine1409-2'-O)-methyltransferase